MSAGRGERKGRRLRTGGWATAGLAQERKRESERAVGKTGQGRESRPTRDGSGPLGPETREREREVKEGFYLFFLFSEFFKIFFQRLLNSFEF